MELELIPRTKTHYDEMSAAERFESYREAASPLCGAEPMRGQDAEDARCSAWLADGLLFCRTAFKPTLFRRTPRQARRSGGFLLQLFQRGDQRGEVNGHAFRCAKDRIVIQDLAHPYSSVAHTEKSWGVLIPRHRINAHEWLYRHQPVFYWPVASPQGRILLHTLQSLMETLPTLHQADEAEVVCGFVGLVNGLLATREMPGDDRFVNQASLEAMKAYLVRNLHAPELSPTTLSQVFHCSRAKVYRFFAEEGGVATFIRNQRLMKCFENLSRAEKKQGTVHEIAERWGFQDPYHFSRLFKRCFDVPPSEILGARTPGDHRSRPSQLQHSGTAVLVQSWVRKTFEPDGSKHAAYSSSAAA